MLKDRKKPMQTKINSYTGVLKDPTLDLLVGKALLDATNTEKELRTPSGKLSASMLWWPLQWQVLKTIGLGGAPFDEYTLRKFERGHHVEKWLVEQMPGVISEQKLIEYRGAIGYADAIVDSAGYQLRMGIIPHEVKSVSNAKFKRIVTQGQPDMGHIYQACFYAMGTKSKFFAIDYVSTDDYRIETYVLPTEKYAKNIDETIDRFNRAMRDWEDKKIVPVFVANEKWQATVNYNNFPTFMKLTEKEASELAVKMLGGGEIV